jgi:hypothetical protein
MDIISYSMIFGLVGFVAWIYGAWQSAKQKHKLTVMHQRRKTDHGILIK